MKNMENRPLSNVSKNEIVTDESACPSCLMEREAKTTECQYCGVVYAQHYRWSKEKRTKLTISGLYHLNVAEIEMLEAAWSRVDAVYADTTAHDQFLHLCLRLKSLPFAAYCYTHRLRSSPADEIATFQLEKVISLSSELFGKVAEEPRSIFNRSLMRIAAALSALGIVAGVLTLFTGLLTTTPGFYLGIGSVVVMMFVAIFAVSKTVAQQTT